MGRSAREKSPIESASPVETSRDDESTNPGTKRRRIALACSACRIRKSRCNGQRPKCSLCERMGFDCTYEVPASSSNVIIAKDIFSALEARVDALEAEVKSKRRGTVHRSKRPNQGDRGLPDFNGVVASVSGVSPGTRIVPLQQDNDHDDEEDRTDTDGMAITLLDEEDRSFFGPTSNIAFMRSIFQAMVRGYAPVQQGSTSAEKPAAVNGFSLSSTRLPTPSIVQENFPSAQAEAYNVLPPDHETEYLIQQYFSNTGALFPYIHEASFMETYHNMKKQNYRTQVRRTWLGLLNMVLAMASWSQSGQASEDATGNNSETFYRRAQRLCRKQVFSGTSLETVQFLLLTSQYLQGTQKSRQTWAMHGLATKVAMSIGIHSSEVLRKLPEIEQEMGKRAWFGCVLLDRHLSMTFGRPCAIPDNYVRLSLPMPFPGDHAGIEGVAFYGATITLYKILWHVIGSLYGHNLGCDEITDASILTQTFQLQQQLNEWSSSLPLEIGTVSVAELPKLDHDSLRLARYRIVLTLRYLNTHLLLHRAVLVKLLAIGPEPPQVNAPIRQMQRNLCRTASLFAQEIISVVHGILTSAKLGRQFLGAWWFTLYYVFNATLVIFASVLVPPSDAIEQQNGIVTLETAYRLLELGIEALNLLDHDNPLLERCVRYVKFLSQKIGMWRHSPPSQPQSMSPFTAQGASITAENNLDGDMSTNFLAFSNDFQLNDNIELDPFFHQEFQRWFGNNTWSADIL